MPSKIGRCLHAMKRAQPLDPYVVFEIYNLCAQPTKNARKSSALTRDVISLATLEICGLANQI